MSDVPRYRVIGPCEVGGVQPGGIVAEEQLIAHGATNIPALIGPHLEEVAGDEPKPVKKTLKAEAP